MPGLPSRAKGTAPTGEGALLSVAAPGCLQSARGDPQAPGDAAGRSNGTGVQEGTGRVRGYEREIHRKPAFVSFTAHSSGA